MGKIFYELTANTQGLERELKGAEKSLGRFSAYVKANPAAAAGALGVALLGIAAKATEMAEGVDKAFRKVGALVPDLANNLKRAQRGVAELAVVTGKSQEQLLQEAEAIAKGGVEGTDDLLRRLRVLQDLADATGGDVATLANGLDQALDVFGLAADKAGEVTAKLFTISQGKAPIEDLFAALQAAAPGIRQLGLDFDTAAAALGTLLNQGLNAKQAGAALKEMAGQGERGAAKLRELAGAGIDTAAALRQMAEADRLVRESASRTAASTFQRYNNELIELGTRILPMVTTGLQALLGLIDQVTGKSRQIGEQAQIVTASVLGQAMASGRIDPRSELDAEKVKRFADAIREVRLGIRAGRLDLAALSREELTQLQQAFDQFARLSATQARGTLPDLFAVRKQVAETSTDIGKLQAQIAALLAGKGAAGSGGTPGDGLAGAVGQTAADLRADLEKQLAGFTETLVDDAVAATERFRDEMGVKLAALSGDERAALQQLVDQVLAAMEARTLLLRAAEGIRTTPRVVGGKDGSIPLRTDYSAADKRMVERTKELKEAEEELADARREAIQEAARQAQAIEEAGRGALQLAESMGLLSDQAAEAAEAVLQIASSAKQLSELSKLEGGASLTEMLPGILSIAGGVASLISGLFGESPEERRRREIQEQNTEAILELSRSIGAFGGRLAGTAGSTTLGVQSAVTSALGSGGQIGVPFRLREALANLGLSMTDLKDVAASLGISFAGALPSVTEMNQLLQAIAANQLAARTGTFAGQLGQLQDIFDVFDITDPLEQLRKLVDLFDDPKFGSPALRQALAGLDLSTPEGRAAAEKAIQELVKRLGLAPDQGGISLGDLGAMTPEEFRQALLDLERRLDELGQTGGPQGETQGFAVSRTITEAQGSLVISQLTTVAYWQERLYHLLDMRMLQPPSIIPGVPQGVAAVDVTIYQNFPAGADPARATEMGSAAGDALVAKLDAALGVRYRTKKLLSGNVITV